MTAPLAHEGDALRQLEGALLDVFTVTDGVARSPHDMAVLIRAALRERGVHLVTVESLARAAQNHETSGIHGSLHCSLACGASLFDELEEEEA